MAWDVSKIVLGKLKNHSEAIGKIPLCLDETLCNGSKITENLSYICTIFCKIKKVPAGTIHLSFSLLYQLTWKILLWYNNIIGSLWTPVQKQSVLEELERQHAALGQVEGKDVFPGKKRLQLIYTWRKERPCEWAETQLTSVTAQCNAESKQLNTGPALSPCHQMAFYRKKHPVVINIPFTFFSAASCDFKQRCIFLPVVFYSGLAWKVAMTQVRMKMTYATEVSSMHSCLFIFSTVKRLQGGRCHFWPSASSKNLSTIALQKCSPVWCQSHHGVTENFLETYKEG